MWALVTMPDEENPPMSIQSFHLTEIGAQAADDAYIDRIRGYAGNYPSVIYKVFGHHPTLGIA